MIEQTKIGLKETWEHNQQLRLKDGDTAGTEMSVTADRKVTESVGRRYPNLQDVSPEIHRVCTHVFHNFSSQVTNQYLEVKLSGPKTIDISDSKRMWKVILPSGKPT